MIGIFPENGSALAGLLFAGGALHPGRGLHPRLLRCSTLRGWAPMRRFIFCFCFLRCRCRGSALAGLLFAGGALHPGRGLHPRLLRCSTLRGCSPMRRFIFCFCFLRCRCRDSALAGLVFAGGALHLAVGCTHGY